MAPLAQASIEGGKGSGSGRRHPRGWTCAAQDRARQGRVGKGRRGRAGRSVGFLISFFSFRERRAANGVALELDVRVGGWTGGRLGGLRKVHGVRRGAKDA